MDIMFSSPVATALVQHGEISVGSVLSSGSAWARVRQMSSDAGKDVSHALPSMPVRISGWRTLPAAGEIVFAVQSEVRLCANFVYDTRCSLFWCLCLVL